VNKTIVTQVIPTIQGEGISVGTPVLLIRLGNCNLNCDFCDSKWANNLKITEVPQFDINNVSLPFILEEIDFENFIKYLKDNFLNKFEIRTILLTGGEPFLYKDFISKLVNYTDLKQITNIEIETNGTLLNNNDDYKMFNYCWGKIIQLNISPKLNPTYYKNEKIKDIKDIIEVFVSNEVKSLKTIIEKTPTEIIWKFVHSKEMEKDIINFIRSFNTMNHIYIMPLTPARANYTFEGNFISAFKTSCLETIDFCIKNGFTFSPREHIWLFNQTKRDEYIMGG